jgi:alpha-beta hydrolase superfamily lysophospholipase
MRLGILCCVAFFVSYIVLGNFINRAVYYPMRYPAGCWDAQAVILAQDRWLQTADGVRLHAWWAPNSGSSVATLFLDGNGGNITHRSQHAVEITSAGSSVLLLDYRGYGRSEVARLNTGCTRTLMRLTRCFVPRVTRPIKL